MPKKGSGGAKIRKALKQPEDKRHLRLKKQDIVVVNKYSGAKSLIESDELYGQVTKRLGGKVVEVLDENKEIRKCMICGRLYKGRRNKRWIKPNDIVLINFEVSQKADKYGIKYGEVCHQYTSSEIFRLENTGELKQEVFNLEEYKSEDMGFDWDYTLPPTEEETEAIKEEKLKCKTYVNYDEIFSSEEEETIIDLDDI